MTTDYDPLVQPRYHFHLNEATMIVSRATVRYVPKATLYASLASYVKDGFVKYDREDFLLRLLAVMKAEGESFPSMSHMQHIMAILWDELPKEFEAEFSLVAEAVADALQRQFINLTTLTMRRIAAAFHTDALISITLEGDTEVVKETEPSATPPPADDEDGEPTRILH